MTLFEEFAKEIIGKVEIGKDGLYTGLTKSLSMYTNEVILSDDETIFNMEWKKQKELIKEMFFSTFPYLRK